MGSAVNLALPAIAREFHFDLVTTGWVATSFLLSAAVFLVPFGRIADLYGRKRIFLTGNLLFCLSSLWAALAWSGWSFFAARILQGLSSAMLFGTGNAILVSVFPPEQRGKVMGINVSAVYLGLALGPVLGGLLTDFFGWRSLFFFPAILGAGVVGMAFAALQGEWVEAKGERFDIMGSLLYAAAIIFLLQGSTHLPHGNAILLLVLGIVCSVVFLILETRLKHPVLEISIFRTNRVFAFSGLAALLNYSATFAVTFLLSLYLQIAKGLNPRHAGLFLLISPVMMTLGSPFAGRLSDRKDPGKLASLGMGLIAMFLVILLFLRQDTPLWLVGVAMAINGIGTALFSSPNANAIMGSVEKRQLGLASSMLGSLRLLGQMMGMGVTLFVINLVVGEVALDISMVPQFLRASHILFVIFIGLCLAGVFASLARIRK